jgi:hypothetical protein
MTLSESGQLKISSNSAWSPCPFIVAAEKTNINAIVNPLEGSTSSSYVDRRWFFWLLFSIEL